MFILSLIILELIFISAVSATIVLPPDTIKNDTEITIALIFQDAQIDAKKYVTFSKVLQQKLLTDTQLWVALAEFPNSTPDANFTDQIVSQVLRDLMTAGISKITRDTPCYFIGIFVILYLQNYLFLKFFTLVTHFNFNGICEYNFFFIITSLNK